MEGTRIRLAEKESAREVVKSILELDNKEQIRVISVLWQWWRERNGVREGDRRRTADDLAEKC